MRIELKENTASNKLKRDLAGTWTPLLRQFKSTLSEPKADEARSEGAPHLCNFNGLPASVKSTARFGARGFVGEPVPFLIDFASGHPPQQL